jgi:glycosyltransferase involved in cell wall biosynthesis
VLLLPSLCEGFGLTALEAMACGTPVITANQSSLPEVVGDAALLVDPLDVGALADAIGRVLSDDTLAKELRERGLARAPQFSWRRTGEAVRRALRAALGEVA